MNKTTAIKKPVIDFDGLITGSVLFNYEVSNQ